MQAELSAGGDENVAVVERMSEVRQAVIAARGGEIELCWTLHAERLMRSFGIELQHEGVEAALLLQGVLPWRPGCLLLQCEVHAFVAAVLLWMAGLDALDCDAETQPPD